MASEKAMKAIVCGGREYESGQQIFVAGVLFSKGRRFEYTNALAQVELAAVVGVSLSTDRVYFRIISRRTRPKVWFEFHELNRLRALEVPPPEEKSDE